MYRTLSRAGWRVELCPFLSHLYSFLCFSYFQVGETEKMAVSSVRNYGIEYSTACCDFDFPHVDWCIVRQLSRTLTDEAFTA